MPDGAGGPRLGVCPGGGEALETLSGGCGDTGGQGDLPLTVCKHTQRFL